jgi:peptidyl-prolyl cis-trans isomerase A (cyclophilin A)
MKKLSKILLLTFILLFPLSNHAQSVIIKTTKGDIEVELYEDKAPETVKNFINYINAGFYNGTIFHRVIRGFMIQGGGYDKDLNLKPTEAPIKNESKNGLFNEAYTIAMARTNDPHSATSQFFINLVDNHFLDDGDGYCVFGKVTNGQRVVQTIGSLPTHVKEGMGDVPIKRVTIKSIELKK